MTETVYEEPLQFFAPASLPEPVQIIPVLEEGEVAIERVLFLFPCDADESRLVSVPLSSRSLADH